MRSISRIKAYRLHVTKKKVSTIAVCLQPSEGEQETIFVHAGTNDPKCRGAEETSKEMVTSMRTLLKKHEKRSIVMSKLAPISRLELQGKREIFSAKLYADLHTAQRATCLGHDNLNPLHAGLMNDDIYPSDRGASALAVQFWFLSTTKAGLQGKPYSTRRIPRTMGTEYK